MQGLRANAGQFALLVGVNALVGAMVGQERTILPILASDTFGLRGATAALTFLVAFGITKAIANLLAGGLADRYGRKPVLVAGWLAGLPVPLLIIAAPDWSWIVAANLLLGINQGFAWSTTVIMKIDLVGPKRRGLALGLNESAGYIAVAAMALATGLLAERFGLRPVPFLLAIACAGLGLGLSTLAVRETQGFIEGEPELRSPGGPVRWSEAFRRTTYQDRTLFAASQAGLVNNLNDGVAWGLLPLHYAAAGLSLAEIGILTAAYPAVWGVLQPGAGALSDRFGRKPFVVAGMLVQGLAIGGIAISAGFGSWLTSAVALGVGTAMVYPTLLATVADASGPSWRARAIGVYRLWRDLGFAAGAVLAGLLADRFGIPPAIGVVALLTAASGVITAFAMRETLVR